MKARYLTFFSYIGSNFRSSEKLWIKNGTNHADPESVQGLMEIALLKLRSINYPRVHLSSRTDGGVHALKSSAHIDLEKCGHNIYDSEHIVHCMNRFFYKHNYSICINKCFRVSDTFNARYSALSRTYLYRFAIIKKGITLPENVNIRSLAPIEEWKRCNFVHFPDFDIEKLKQGAEFLPGYHDFSTFKSFDKRTSNKQNRRLIHSVEIKPGKSIVTSYSTINREEIYDYWDVYFHGRAFVHNQIRRIMGALFGVATGKIEPEEIKVMLQVPSKHSWPTKLNCCPPDGLYLCNVEYDAKDLVYNSLIAVENKEEISDVISDCE